MASPSFYLWNRHSGWIKRLIHFVQSCEFNFFMLPPG